MTSTWILHIMHSMALQLGFATCTYTIYILEILANIHNPWNNCRKAVADYAIPIRKELMPITWNFWVWRTHSGILENMPYGPTDCLQSSNRCAKSLPDDNYVRKMAIGRPGFRPPNGHPLALFRWNTCARIKLSYGVVDALLQQKTQPAPQIWGWLQRAMASILHLMMQLLHIRATCPLQFHTLDQLQVISSARITKSLCSTHLKMQLTSIQCRVVQCWWFIPLSGFNVFSVLIQLLIRSTHNSTQM